MYIYIYIYIYIDIVFICFYLFMGLSLPLFVIHVFFPGFIVKVLVSGVLNNIFTAL